MAIRLLGLGTRVSETLKRQLKLQKLPAHSYKSEMNVFVFLFRFFFLFQYTRFNINRIENWFCIAFGIADFVMMYIYSALHEY